MPQNLARLSKNPVRVARKANNLTLQRFAEKCKVTLNAVYMQECGLYPYILPKILQVLVNELKQHYYSLTDEYNEFVKETRYNFYDKYGPFHYREIEVDATKSPLTVFRESLKLSKMAFCKNICIQPSILNKVERGIAQTIPEAIQCALLDIGFDMEACEELHYRQGEFCARA